MNPPAISVSMHDAANTREDEKPDICEECDNCPECSWATWRIRWPGPNGVQMWDVCCYCGEWRRVTV